MRPYTDEELVAYADGELPAAKAEEIAQAAKVDASVEARIEAFRESRRLLKAAFAPRASEPVPKRLLEALAEPKSNVRPFPRKPESRIRWQTWVPMAAAALVVLGVGLNANRFLGHRATVDLASADAALADQNLVNQALESSPSGVPVAMNGQEVLPLNTLRTDAGRWCREFEARAGTGETLHKSRGVACREGDSRWDLRVIAAAPQNTDTPADPGYQTASGGHGPDLSNTIGKAQPLTPAEEQEKIQRHWE